MKHPAIFCFAFIAAQLGSILALAEWMKTKEGKNDERSR